MSAKQEDIMQFLDDIYETACANGKRIERLSGRKRHKYVRDAIKRAEVVFAIWFEGEAQHNMCVKGAALPEGLRRNTAFFVGSVVDAIGMQGDGGDGEAGVVPPLSALMQTPPSKALH
jgi:hypothetical protein